MKKNLLIIESPNKIKTLSKYLGNDFEIIATVGHIRELSKFGLGFDISTFEPKWVVTDDSKKEIIKTINDKAKEADEIYIATDPDREGEAIAWHVYETINDKEKAKCKRITFNEITKNAILESFNHKREINIDWVKSQFTRRIIDRLIGFKLSQLLQSKLKAESAGRVQSVALKFIKEREEEIKNFTPVKWYTIDSNILKNISLNLKKLNSKFNFEEQKDANGSNFKFCSEEEAKEVYSTLSKEFKLTNISEAKEVKSSPKKPYKTSTLQQDAINKLNFSAKQTTSISQKLYEGIEIDGNAVALISYPRTDSTRLSDTFINSTTNLINENYGSNYLGNYKNEKQSDTSQDAHEAIRPVDPFITPESLKGKIPKKELDLYRLIWERSISAMMADAKFERTTFTFINNDNTFEASSKVCIFDGYQKVMKNDDDEEAMIKSKLTLGDNYNCDNIEIKYHESSPPARFTQASLISTLEKAGVGRPSTYNSIVNIVLDRNYATLEKKAYHVTKTGDIVIEKLDEFFPEEINKDFTRKMEEHLDNIASGEEEWTSWLKEFAPKFQERILVAREGMEKVQDEKVGRACPSCGNDLVYKVSKKYKNKFIGCSNYPNCNYIESLKAPSESKELDIPCPLCSKNIIIRKNKKGSEFIACTGFPKCKYLLDMKKFNEHQEKNPNKPLPIIKK